MPYMDATGIYDVYMYIYIYIYMYIHSFNTITLAHFFPATTGGVSVPTLNR